MNVRRRRLARRLRAHGARCAIALAIFAAPASATDGPAAAMPGAYCPLPEPGQKPQCLTDAEASYGEFFDELESGDLSDSTVAALEADLESEESGGARRYVALSSLVYGYYRLAQQARADARTEPLLVERLSRWNAILSRTYDESAEEPEFRSAVRTAAEDLHARAPAVDDACADGQDCPSTEGLLSRLATIDSRLTTRAPLMRILERFSGGEEPEAREESEER